MEVAIKNFKIQDTSNLLTTSDRMIKLDGDCECVNGSISGINNVELDFNF